MLHKILLAIGTYVVSTLIGKDVALHGNGRAAALVNKIAGAMNQPPPIAAVPNYAEMLNEIAAEQDEATRTAKTNNLLEQISSNNQPPPDNNRPPTGSFHSIVDKLLDTIKEIGVLKLAFGLFLLILIFTPWRIAKSVQESKLEAFYESGLEITARYVETADLFNAVFKMKQGGKIDSALVTLDSLIQEVPDGNLQNRFKSALTPIETLNTELTNKAAAKDPNNQKQGWVYLGINKNNIWIESKLVGSSPLPAAIKPNNDITLSSASYLRASASECNRASGEIVTAVAAGVSLEVLGDVQTCPKTNTAWVLVKSKP